MPHYVLEAIPLDRSKLFSISKLEAEVRTATYKVRNDMIADLRRVVATWNTAVAFRSRIEFSRGDLVLYVFTDNKIFKFVNDGTKSHVIVPRRARALRVKFGFTPKTRYKDLNSSAGGYQGPFVLRKFVSHPGTAARDFTGALADKYRIRYHTIMTKALRSFFSSV